MKLCWRSGFGQKEKKERSKNKEVENHKVCLINREQGNHVYEGGAPSIPNFWTCQGAWVVRS